MAATKAKKNLSETEMNQIAVNTQKAIAKQKKYTVILPEKPNEKFLTFCVNDVHYTVQRGVPVEVPETIYRIIENMKTQERMAQAVQDKLKKMSGRSL